MTPTALASWVTPCDDACEALDAFAKNRGADLIVIDAYGRGRLRGLMFGGVTKRFLKRGVSHVFSLRVMGEWIGFTAWNP